MVEKGLNMVREGGNIVTIPTGQKMIETGLKQVGIWSEKVENGLNFKS